MLRRHQRPPTVGRGTRRSGAGCPHPLSPSTAPVVFVARNLSKIYRMGETEVHALRAVDEAIALVELTGRAHHFPSRLSGGEQQRVAIARAIAKRPDVLLCDEPTGALDYATGKIVLDAIAKINRDLGTTTVVITHNAPIASWFATSGSCAARSSRLRSWSREGARVRIRSPG